ncbi:MAG: Rieske 2Fe-2S domain-containing protein [Gemmatimonas sp.]|nr:Rieske 2Fe-2S domain-containing protein [Gemmatimonas sp.]
MDRRRWMSRLSLTLCGLAAAVAGVPILGFFLAPFVSAHPERWRGVGRVSQFPVGSTTTVRFEDPSSLPWSGQVAKTAAWLRREGEASFIAFSLDCTHLGCPVRWEEQANLFMCPCHGGVYYSNGEVAGGPPPRPLTRYPVRVRGDAVEIHTTPLPIT